MKIIEDFTAIRYTPDVLARNGVKALVIHSMDGFYKGSISWFKNPEGRGSAHYLISKEGKIRQMVREKDMAWHAGIYDDEHTPAYLKPNPNHCTIGIELEDQGKADWKYPKAEKDALIWLVGMLRERYKLAKKNIHLHKELNPSRRSDPQGDFSRTWLFQNVEVPTLPNVADSTQRVEQIIIDGYEALTGEGVKDAEKIWRLETWENTVVFLKSLTGDGRFHKKFVLPYLEKHEEELKVTISRAKLDKDIFWQSKVETANILTEEAKVKREKDVLIDADFSTLFNYTLKKLLSFKKTKGGEA